MRCVPAAEFLAIRHPDAALTINADLGIGVANGSFIGRPRRAFLNAMRRFHFGDGQFSNRLEELTVLQADHTNGALAVERIAGVGSEGAEVLAPELGAFFVGDSEGAVL